MRPSVLSRLWDRLRGRTPLPRDEAELQDYLYGPGTAKERAEVRDEMRAAALAYEVKEAAQTQALLTWLQGASPDDWHRCAVTFDWDYSVEPLRWIAAQPDCDRGTAILLFHVQRPWYYLPYAGSMATFWDHYVGDRELSLLVTERWRSGAYRSYRFDPVVRQGVPPGSLPWPVPDDLCTFPVAGEVLDVSAFAHGYPRHLLGAKLV